MDPHTIASQHVSASTGLLSTGSHTGGATERVVKNAADNIGTRQHVATIQELACDALSEWTLMNKATQKFVQTVGTGFHGGLRSWSFMAMAIGLA